MQAMSEMSAHIIPSNKGFVIPLQNFPATVNPPISTQGAYFKFRIRRGVLIRGVALIQGFTVFCYFRYSLYYSVICSHILCIMVK